MIFLRIFKNRGDFYIPATKFKSDREQKILLAILAFVVAFTAVFILIVGIKYDFSAKKFFTPKNINVEEIDNINVLPEVEGKNNFLFIMKNDVTEDIYVCSLIQVDLDNFAYKVSTLDVNTNIEGNDINNIYKRGGAGNVVNAINNLLGIDIDYFIDLSVKKYKEMFDVMGNINYTVLSDIRYKDTSTYGFNIKIKEGDQNINGDTASKLMRYYLTEKRYDLVNEILLTSLSQQINPENYEKREKLFSRFIDSAATNITIKSFSEGDNGMRVLSSENTGANVYSAYPIYEDNNIISSSIDDIRGYFVK